LLSPKVLERRRAQLRVARRVLERPTAEPILDASRVVAGIGERVAAGMPKHMGMDGEGEAGALADALDEPIDGIGRERVAAFGGEHEGRVPELRAQLAQRSDFAAEWMRARLAVLGAAHV
jgi:hypothetical protein